MSTTAIGGNVCIFALHIYGDNIYIFLKRWYNVCKEKGVFAVNRKITVKVSARALVMMLALLFVLPVQCVSAAMKDADTITLDISNIPEDAAYIDVLIDFENGENYTKLNEDNLKRYDFDSDELAKYNEDGFVSYSCHFRGIKTDMKIKEGKTVFVDEKTERQFYFDHNSLKIAVLDKNGHIMQVSDAVDIKNDSTDIYLVGDIKYDVGENKVDPDMFDNSTNDLALMLAYAPWLVLIILIIFVVLVAFITRNIVIHRKKKAAVVGTEQTSESSKALIITGCLVVITLAFAVIVIKFMFFSI